MKLKTIAASLAAVALIASMPSCKRSESTFEKVDLIPVKTSKDGNWGMMDKKGRIVYDAEFKNAPTVAYNGFFSVEESDGYTVYSADGSKPKAVAGLENLKSVGYMEDGLMPVTFPNSRITVVDEKGAKKFELAPVKNQEVVSCSNGFCDGLLRFTLEDEKMGYINKKGKVVIQPKYDSGTDFNEGLAIVSTMKSDSTGREYTVINTSGEKQFSLKDFYEPMSPRFKDGKLLVRNDEVYYFLDKKGEKTKLSSKFKGIVDYNEDYIIFRNGEGQYGVGDIEGEIIIRPKYLSVSFVGDDTFLAEKEDDSDTFVLLDKKGEVKKELDYKDMGYVKGFGYFAKEGSTYQLLNDKFESKCKEDIYDISLSMSSSYIIYTDYFDVNGVAKNLVGMIGSDGIGSYKLDSPVSQVMKGSEPRQFTYQSEYTLDDLKKHGFRYDVSVTALFTAAMAQYDYDYYSYSSNYYWNPASKLGGFMINLTSESEWGENGFKALKSAMSAAGFKERKSGVASGNYAAIYEKGDEMVAIVVPAKGTGCDMMVYSNKLYPSYTDMISQDIDPNGTVSEYDTGGGSFAKPEYEEAEETVAVVETVETVEAVDDYPEYAQ